MTRDESIATLAQLIAFNERHADQVMPIFDQSTFRMAQEKGGLDSPEYLQALENSHAAMRGILDAALKRHNVDVIVAPVNAPSWKTDWVNGDSFSLSSSSLAAVSGYPSVAVPAGEVSGLPIGLAFIGAAFDEQALIQYAYAFEQATQARREPQFEPRVAVEESLP